MLLDIDDMSSGEFRRPTGMPIGRPKPVTLPKNWAFTSEVAGSIPV
jgi:hypothetical protein